jgi:two-component system, OmpR family, alkaline phosphatase synthesis response regulator PhoP
MSNKILIVDDEQDITEFIQYNLQKEGFLTEVASDGLEALKKADSFKPDLILLDVMMPKMDGIEVCRIIKSDPSKNIAIVFLTARDEEYSELAGFEVGADDYIPKPLKPRVLISRIKAVLKRKNPNEEVGNVINLRDVTINRSTYQVFVFEKEFALPKKEFELLFLLASKPGRVFTREAILSEVWGEDVLVVDRTIDVHIRKIREKIGDERIKTIKGVGYKFEEI